MAWLEKLGDGFRNFKEKYHDLKLYHLKPSGFEYIDDEKRRRAATRYDMKDNTAAAQRYDPIFGPEPLTDPDDIRHLLRTGTHQDLLNITKTRLLYHKHVLATIDVLKRPPTEEPVSPLTEADLWTAVGQLIKSERYIGPNTPTPYNSPPPRKHGKDVTFAESLWSNPWLGLRWDQNPFVNFHITESTFMFFLLVRLAGRFVPVSFAWVNRAFAYARYRSEIITETAKWIGMGPVPRVVTRWDVPKVIKYQLFLRVVQRQRLWNFIIPPTILIRSIWYWLGFCLFADNLNSQTEKSYAPFVSGGLFFFFAPGLFGTTKPLSFRHHLFHAPAFFFLTVAGVTAYTAAQLQVWRPDSIAALRKDPEAWSTLKTAFTQPFSYLVKDIGHAIHGIFMPITRWRRLSAIRSAVQDAEKFEEARGGLYWSALEVGDMLQYWSKDLTQPIDIMRLATKPDDPTLRVVENPIAAQISDGGWAKEHGLSLPHKPHSSTKAQKKATSPVSMAPTSDLVPGEAQNSLVVTSNSGPLPSNLALVEAEERADQLSLWQRAKHIVNARTQAIVEKQQRLSLLEADPPAPLVPDAPLVARTPPPAGRLRRAVNGVADFLGVKAPLMRPGEERLYQAQLPRSQLAAAAYPPVELPAPYLPHSPMAAVIAHSFETQQAVAAQGPIAPLSPLASPMDPTIQVPDNGPRRVQSFWDVVKLGFSR